MKLTTAGVASGFDKAIVGIAAMSPLPLGERSKRIWVGTSAPTDVTGYRGIITIADNADETRIPKIHRVREIDHITDGDIVVMEPGSGFVRSLYRPADKHNSIFTTERCNSNCVMCSQPPKDKDDIAELSERNLELVRLIDPAPPYLTITGGEPTLLGDKLFTLISTLGKKMPSTALHMLTNGRKFAWGDFTADFAAVNHPNLSLGIPLYSDVASEHDFVVQAKDAFDQTIMGLHQLARRGQRVEIRVVLHAKTVERLPELAEFIYRNLTFVEHVALMGLENIGYAPRNMNVLWADSHDYQDKLHEAVLILRRRAMNVSIYNHQLCVLKPELWKYAKKSISDWKNIYIEKCEGCELKDDCGGFFKWATKLHSAHIHPLRRDDARP
jgi:His-Xaa-Ser system radical SAM maturase HxsC